MKFLVAFALCFCIVFSAFSQSASTERFQTLNTAMTSTISRSTETLSAFDSMVKEDGDIKNYTEYKRKYDFLLQTLQDSEAKLNLLLRTNDRSEYIQEERDRYEALVNDLQTLNSEYGNWLRSVQ